MTRELYIRAKVPYLFGRSNLGEWPKRSKESFVDVDLARLKEDVAQITYFGHRTVYIQVEGARLMTDPVLAKRLMSGGIGVKRVSNKMYKYWELPPADILLISNNSYDCLDTWTLRIISDQGGALAVGGRRISRYLNMFFKRYTYPLLWYESVNFGCVEITFLPAMSETRRKLLSCGIDRNRMLWGGFLIRSDTKTIFYAGKTAFSEHFDDIRRYIAEKGYSIDLSLLPIGPICGHGRNMSPEDAVKAHELLGSDKSLIIAHDTFPLGVEAFGELKDRLLKEASSRGISDKFIFLREGETLCLD
ncbi:hypothetical protein BEWA_032550 [Theileria equi strain WA]|uniref:Metallo-beta-lactamase domain-containing protein n=1 Tax=Theileria equi strain WA TaxID=1537102 RepID=L0AXW5_THEEQ|nr:hypothetical protein BEWA_032550 [Theileria equi strain WA]AFZ80402.1 hypothetical protein BEWA_032550 [Theileria equi strain WA]|eukprot:XP_004830068.1 hypothetical protein BEWA_032550 [Theileria equi strain WA]